MCSDADVSTAAAQCLVGSTAYNGERCTAIKLIFLSETLASSFLDKLVGLVEGLKAGLPWESGVHITPLPQPDKISFLTELIADAESKGAQVLNENGGHVHGNIFFPAIVYPVNPSMRLYHEEQFGPIIPIASFKGPEEVYTYLSSSKYGQQAAIFTSSAETLAAYIDLLSHVVGRINVNTQCGRSPDNLPFSGRRSSAMGTLSVSEAIKVFSVETVVAGKVGTEEEGDGEGRVNGELIRDAERLSRFLAPL